MFVFASRIAVAPKVDVPLLFHIVQLQMFHRVCVIVKRCVYVPRLEEAIPMRMKKCDHGWYRGVVIIDDVSQVSHRFMALIYWRDQFMVMPRFVRRINCINCMLPAVKVSATPKGKSRELKPTLKVPPLPTIHRLPRELAQQ